MNEKEDSWPFCAFTDLYFHISLVCLIYFMQPYLLCRVWVRRVRRYTCALPSEPHVLVFFQEVLCYPLPVLEFCPELKTLQDFPVQPTWAWGFQREREREPWHSVSWDSHSWDEEKRICSRLKNSSRGVLMQHCNDGEFCHWPGLLSAPGQRRWLY